MGVAHALLVQSFVSRGFSLHFVRHPRCMRIVLRSCLGLHLSVFTYFNSIITIICLSFNFHHLLFLLLFFACIFGWGFGKRFWLINGFNYNKQRKKKQLNQIEFNVVCLWVFETFCLILLCSPEKYIFFFYVAFAATLACLIMIIIFHVRKKNTQEH